MPTLLTLNIKHDMPTVDQARRLILELDRAKKQGYKAIKLIHGYGSIGKGGVLKDALRKSLSLRRSSGIRLWSDPGDLGCLPGIESGFGSGAGE